MSICGHGANHPMTPNCVAIFRIILFVVAKGRYVCDCSVYVHGIYDSHCQYGVHASVYPELAQYNCSSP